MPACFQENVNKKKTKVNKKKKKINFETALTMLHRDLRVIMYIITGHEIDSKFTHCP